jgi:hypothetical protein
MLWSVSDRKMRQISSAANQPSRRRPARTPQSEQRLKRGHRGFSAVMSKRKLVEIDLHMVTADAMVRADEPLLQVADRAVGQGHDRRHATPQSGFVRLGAANVPMCRTSAAFTPSHPFRPSVGTPAEAWRYTTNGGLLKQADKQERANVPNEPRAAAT